MTSEFSGQPTHVDIIPILSSLIWSNFKMKLRVIFSIIIQLNKLYLINVLLYQV